MSDDLPENDSDIRRRAAWLLAMLALVAALFVALMITFFNSSGGDGDGRTDELGGPTDSVGSTPAAGSGNPSRGPASTGAGPSGGSTSPGESSSSGTPGTRSASCPDRKPCALDDDIGNAVDAINAYRSKNGKSPVPGSVSDEAKTCALNNGNGCKGGWAETQVAKPDGDLAVKKIRQFGRLLSDMKAIEVGWAYDPGAKQYYFAIIRQP